ncbi:hypothetical protein VTJ49DRAFT_5028 [Mycothermus thermophilus]|uniref:VWFA domain-containing protein n=1 Tax=Humicola insolens TaxID=85995 RepID=A0ABR3V562_HUMIN
MSLNPFRGWSSRKKQPASNMAPTNKSSQKETLTEHSLIEQTNHYDKDSLVQIHPVPASGEGLDGIIVKIQPPKEPKLPSDRTHVPCDIVLSIDVSGSMDTSAPVPSVPGEHGQQEQTGLTVLDLVKHAALTIVETLDEGDRLGIVTFSTRTEMLQRLTPMTEENKAETRRRIKNMQTQCATNLWHGITDGLKLFRNVAGQAKPPGRVPALLVLTDGVPNHMCPRQGYVPKLRGMQPLPASIHTFGFGYSLRSGLLKSIAEIGGGSYNFIPDAGMIGTVFVHAVANLQSTFANNAHLTLTYPSYLQLQETTGQAVDKKEPVDDHDAITPLTTKHRTMRLTISLNDLRYGQSRDIYLAYGSRWEAIQAAAQGNSAPEEELTATLTYQRFTAKTQSVVARCDPLVVSVPEGLALDPAETAYHVSRSKLVEFLAGLAPLDKQGEHQPLAKVPEDMAERLARLVADLPAARHEFAGDENCRTEVAAGVRRPGTPDTVTSAASTESFSDVATAVVDEDDSDSDNNSPPTPTSTTFSSASTTSSSLSPSHHRLWWITAETPATWTGQIALALLNATYYSRWGEHYLPSLAGAHARQACNSFKDAGPLRYGRDSPLFAKCRDRLDEAFDNLPPPEPSAPVVRYYQTGTTSTISRGGGFKTGGMVLVTPWHPIRRLSAAAAWEFPKDASLRTVRYTGAVYSVQLERDDHVEAHAMLVNGVWSVTLGHGLTGTAAGERQDVRSHAFFGDYDKVSASLARLPRKEGGLVLAGGVMRDPKTGNVCGFSRMPVKARTVSSGRKKVAFHA